MKLQDLFKILSWDVLNPFLLKIKKNRIYKIGRHTGINLGCGLDNPPNWIGIDGGITLFFVHKFPKCISRFLFKIFRMSQNYSFDEYHKKAKSLKLIHHELLYGIPFFDNTIPNIYSSHFFEHIFLTDARYLLNECYRVLRPSGVMRIAVPSLDEEIKNIEKALKEYKIGNIDQVQHYVTSEIIGFNDRYSNHRYMYNFDKLKILFEEFGFKNIKQHKFKEGAIPDVELLDTRESLFVEAFKLKI
jgi:predicted SAM-dependent methyltransferase